MPGRMPLVIETLGPGELLGVSWLFAPYRWTFDSERVGRRERGGAGCGLSPSASATRTPSRLRLDVTVCGAVADRLQATRLQLLDVYGHGEG